ncbi:unnamed protein product [Gordionus sp. m RMFG-2023]|uniref:probable G-protein coupled receptor B0563.6 n=1 Tax=Gordionus sp. m RMFG-2023 TaxID=3053472 RepID=UPI0030DFD079
MSNDTLNLLSDDLNLTTAIMTETNVSQVPRLSPMEMVDLLEYEMKTYLITIYWVIAPILIFLGLLGNILTLLIIDRLIKMSKSGSVAAAHVFIKWMAISDIIDCLLFIPYPIMYYIGRWERLRYVYRHWYIFYVSRVHFVFLNSFYKISAFLIVLIALDRFIAICYALKYKSICKIGRVHIAIAVSYFLGIAMAVNETFKYSPDIRDDKTTGKRIWFVTINSTVSRVLLLYIYLWLKEILSSILPMILLCYFNYRISLSFANMMKKKKVIAIEKSVGSAIGTVSSGVDNSAEGKKVQTVSTEDRELTSLMIGIVIVYFAANIPMSLHFILAILKPSLYSTKPFMGYLHLTNILAMVHSSANFYIYLYFNKSFRRILLDMFSFNKHHKLK